MTRLRTILAATPAYLIAFCYLALGVGCLIAGLIWTFATGIYRLLTDHADDYPYADYTDEDEPDHVARKMGVP